MINRLCGSLLILLLSITSVFSQKKYSSPYQLDKSKELPLIAAGLGMSLAGFSREPVVVFRQEEAPGGVTVKHLLGLEKNVAGQVPIGRSTTGDWLTRGVFLLPLTLMTDAEMRHDAGKLSVLYSETLLLTNGLAIFSRRFSRGATINLADPEIPQFENLIPRGRLSFFAGHTPVAASLSFCTAKIWSDYHPDSKWKPFVWGAAALLPAASGYLDYRAGNCDFTDMATGYAMGALVGYLVPHLHKVNRHSKRKLRFSSSMVGGTPVFIMRGLL